MTKKIAALLSLFVLLIITGNSLNAQQSKSNLSVFIENQEDFIELKDEVNIFHFHILYDDRYTSAKEIQATAMLIPDIEKFGIRNTPDMESGRYLCYLKTTSKDPMPVFNMFLKKFSCKRVSYEEENISVKTFNKKINNLK